MQSMAGVLRVFDLATGAELYETAGPVNRIGFSADSRRIIWANDRMVRLVDARTGKEQRRWLEGRTTALPSVVQASGKHPASQVATGAPNTRVYSGLRRQLVGVREFGNALDRAAAFGMLPGPIVHIARVCA